jgi:outer membrane protein assembly factor BamB
MTERLPRTASRRRAVRCGWRLLAAGLCAVLAAPRAAGPQVRIRAAHGWAAASPQPTSSGKPLPLVNVDEDEAGGLRKAEKYIEDGDHAEAIELLRALLDKAGTGVVRTAEGRRFVSVRLSASRLIGRLGPEGLARYRKLFDPQAERLYRRGVAGGDLALLREVVDRRLHTSFGAPAVRALGALHFDRGHFAQAARCWARSLEMADPQADRALTLAKLAAAYHLAGRSGPAEAAHRRLKREFPNATAMLGGRQQGLAAFVSRLRASRPAAATAVREFREHWPGYGAVPDGVATMDESDVVLAATWRAPSVRPGQGLGSLIVSEESVLGTSPHVTRSAVSFSTRLQDGHVEVLPKTRHGHRGRYRLPPFVHPVVVDDVLFYRSAQAVVGCDLTTGRKICGADLLPVQRELRQTAGRRYLTTGLSKVGEQGRYTLTVGGDKVFAVANFRPAVRVRHYRGAAQPAQRGHMGDTSELAALSIPGQLRLLWRVGNLQGDDEVVRNGKFLCAPAYHEGRLYVPVVHLQNHWLVCLEAETGKLVWKAEVAQQPAVSSRYRYALDALHSGSPPALADGRLFVSTNAGVVAAFDAVTGSVIWAYQYPSGYEDLSGGRRSVRRTAGGVGNPPNPLIVTGGKVICLPPDSEELLVLSTEDGRPLWTPDRIGQRRLTAIDSQRLLLSGPGLMVLDPHRRTVLCELDPPGGVNGRPAVTPHGVLAPGRGRVLRLDLSSYALEAWGLAGGAEMPGLLGNLVSVRGVLLAANAGGVCAYMGYDLARARLTDRLQKAAGPAQRAGLLMKRGLFAFSARRFEEAIEDFLAADAAAEKHRLQDVREAGLRSWIYRTYVALGNQAGDPPTMLANFRKARDYARTDQEKALMQLRLAKFHLRQAGRLAAQDDEPAASPKVLAELKQAVSLAQDLGERYAEEDIPDAAIGEQASDEVRYGQDVELFAARRLATGLIDKLIGRFGRQAYAELDAQASAALEQARAAADPNAMVAVARRWANSLWADDALLAAAESLYRRGAADEGEAADRDLAEAMRRLGEVAMISPDPAVRVAAEVGLAMACGLGGREYGLVSHCDKAREIADQLPGGAAGFQVAFADREGPLPEVLDALRADGAATGQRRVLPYSGLINPPLRKTLAIKDEAMCLVRDQHFAPLRFGQRVVALRGRRLVMINTMARKPNEAITWAALTEMDPKRVFASSLVAPGGRLVGGLSRDRDVLAISDRQTAHGFDLRTAKAVWTAKLGQMGISSARWMGTGEGVLIAADSGGKVLCVDLSTGAKRWLTTVQGGRSKRPAAPPLIASGLVVVRQDSGRVMSLLNLRNGKLARSPFKAKRRAYAAFADSGMLVVQVDGEVAAYDPARLDKPAWQRRYNASHGPAVLAVGRDYAAVSPSAASDAMEVLSMDSGRVAAKFSVRADGGVGALPVDARFDGQALYVVSSVGRIGSGRKHYDGELSLTRGAMVSKHVFARGNPRRVWSETIDDNASQNFYLLPLTLGLRHVILTLRSVSTRSPGMSVVLDADSGRQKARFEPTVGRPVAAAVRNQLRRLGPPVMTNGWLCVETLEGVTIHGGE